MSSPWLVIDEPFTAEATGTGSGYADGIYFGVALNGAGGTGAQATVTIASNVVIEIEITNDGTGYTTNTPFTVALTDGGGSGITLDCFTGGLTDQTERMYAGEGQKHSYSQVLLQRSQADVPLVVYPDDDYAPTVGCPVWLYDQTSGGQITNFVGRISRVELTWDGVAGNRLYHLTCVDLVSCLDVIRVPPQGFTGQFAGAIVTNLFNALMAGAPITLGTIDQGEFVPNLSVGNYPRLSEVIQKLATESNFVWGVDPGTQTLYFTPLNTTPSPFSLATDDMQWETMHWQINQDDYRNRQILQIQLAAFAQSSEAFAWNGVLPAYFNLLRAPDQITFAWITQGTQSQALGTFSGLPSPGDTITIGYPTSGSIYQFQNNYPYVVGQIVIDPSGVQQVISAAGTSAVSGVPDWQEPIGAITDTIVGGGSLGVAFTSQGIPLTNQYTFVTALQLDNTVWGEVVIDDTGLTTPDKIANTIRNLVDAINCYQGPTGQGVEFSFPTWENPLVNAYSSASAQFGSGIAANQIMVRDKAAGPYTSQLSKSCANFTWSGATTTGGAASNTVPLNVAINGTSATANIYYTPGQLTVALASIPAGVSSNAKTIQIQYTRLGGDCIICENTHEVRARAAIEHGTGKYQQFTSDLNQANAAAGLSECQAALAAFLPIPTSFTFDTLTAGLIPGQYLAITISDSPPGIAALVNGAYVVQEVRGELIPLGKIGDGVWLDLPAGVGSAPPGHYRYTVTVIDVAQIGSWVRFWQDLLGGGGGGGLGGGGGGGGSQLYWNTLDLKDTTVGNDIADVQWIRASATGLRITGALRLPISADLVVRCNAGGSAVWTFTIPHATLINTLVVSTTFASNPQAFTVDQILTWDVVSSDGTIAPNGVATVTFYYQ